MKLDSPEVTAATLSLLAQGIDEAVAIYDAGERLAWWNARFPEFFPELAPRLRRGLPFVETAETLYDLMNPNGGTADSRRAFVDRAVERHRRASGPIDYQRPDDGRWLRLTLHDLPDGGRLKIWRDATALYEKRFAEHRLAEALSQLNLGLMLSDPAHRLQYINTRFFVALFGGYVTDPSPLYGGEPGAFWRAVAPAFEATPELDLLVATDRPSLEPMVVRTHDGRWIRIEEQRSDTGYTTIFVDVTELKRREAEAGEARADLERSLYKLRRVQAELVRSNEQLTVMAETDPLTAVMNRRKFIEHARHEFARSLRYGREMALIMVDIDHFKKINDTWGHLAGDAALMRTAERLSSSVRSIDFIGRLGGEEFAVLLPETPKAAASALAERLRIVIAEISLPEEHGAISLTASFGVSAREPGDREMLNVLARADRALYAAKRGGRDQVAVG